MVALAVEAASSFSGTASAVFLKGDSVAESAVVFSDKVLSEADLHVLVFVAVVLAASLISDANVGNKVVVLPVAAAIVSLGKLPDGEVGYLSVSEGRAVSFWGSDGGGKADGVSVLAVAVLSSRFASAVFLKGVSVAEAPEVVPDKVLSEADLHVALFVAVVFAASFISDAVVRNRVDVGVLAAAAIVSVGKLPGGEVGYDAVAGG